jgi:GTP cyclohydrolase I
MTELNLEAAEKAIHDFLVAMGQPIKGDGMKLTPKRFVKFWKEFTEPDQFQLTTFDSQEYDGIVISKDIPFFSICEHHLAPFFGTAAIAYIPDGKKIVGISKLPRTLELFARRPQNQERITKQVAAYLMEKLDAKGVAVILQARHMCQEMRGVKKPGTQTITSEMLGVFKADLNARNELMNLLQLNR